MRRASALPRWLLWAAVFAAFGAYALILVDVSLWHPGFSYGDERNAIVQLQDVREGAPLLWQFSRGCLTRAIQWAWVSMAGTGLESLHVPEMAITGIEWLLLAVVARRWFGEECACWSVLALTVCAQTWVRERSLLTFQALPMETLLLASLAPWVRGRLSALLWGVGASLLFLDYDGAFIAVPWLWLACVAYEPSFRRRYLLSLLGLALGAGAIAWHGHTSLVGYVQVRLGRGPARTDDQGWLGRIEFLRDVFTGGPVLPYFGVTSWPAWPLWAWAGLATGLWISRGSRAVVLALWVISGIVVTQMVHSSYGLPLHRLAVVTPALAILSGLGFCSLRQRLGPKAWMLGFLVVAGMGMETWGWLRHQWIFSPELYDRSESLQRVREVYAAELVDPRVRLVTQLDGYFEGDARFVLGQGPGPRSSPPEKVLALVPADYAGALKGSGLRETWLWVEHGYEPSVVVIATGRWGERLMAIEDAVAPLIGNEQGDIRKRRDSIDAWLAAPIKRDPWALTAAIEADLQAAVQTDGVSPEEFARLNTAPLVSAAPWMVIARTSHRSNPKTALQYCQRALALNRRDGEALLIEEECLHALGDPRADEVARTWVDLRATGTVWRHTL